MVQGQRGQHAVDHGVGGGLRRAALLAATALLAAACGASPARPSASPPPATSETSPTVGAGGHVVIVVLENKEYGQVIGSPDAPYLNGLASRFALARQYFGATHPSLPNYLTLIGGSDFGIHDDDPNHVLDAPTIVDRLEGAGLTWRAYLEGLTPDTEPPCSFQSGAPGYAKKHNPFAFFSGIQNDANRCAGVRPYDALAGDTLANLTWITPDQCHDMHDCPVATGDAWLAANLPPILGRLSGNDLLFVVFDEGVTDERGGGHTVCVVAGPGARAGATSDATYSHASLLRTIEDRFGLAPLGGSAAAAPMNDLLR